jgi:hypothetical protein
MTRLQTMRVVLGAGCVAVLSAFSVPALAVSYVTSPSQCPAGQGAIATGPPSDGVQIYECIPNPGQPTNQGFPTGTVPYTQGGFKVTTAPIDAPGWGDSALGSLINGDIAGNGRNGPANDPHVDVSSTRDSGAGVTSASGAVSGQAQSSRTTDIGAGADGHISASTAFDLAAYQRLVIAGFFQYDSQRTSYSSSPTAVFTASTATRNIYTLGGLAQYDAGNSYFGAGVAAELGNGSISGPGDSGNFNSHGYVAAGYVGRVFTLLDTTNSSSARSPLPTKAPPKPTSGYALNLDLNFHLGYVNDQINGFVDSTGFARGPEQIDYWDVGGIAKLYWVLSPSGRITWSPFVAATIDQEFGYSHSLDLPAQAALPGGDTFFYGSAQTFGGAELGIDALDVSGISFGLKAYYRQSQEFQVVGGLAYVKFPILVWLGAAPVTGRN